MPTLRLKSLELRKLGNSDEKNWKAQITAYYQVLSLKIKFYTYVENNQKAMLKLSLQDKISSET